MTLLLTAASNWWDEMTDNRQLVALSCGVKGGE
jgi:hypothetical protein